MGSCCDEDQILQIAERFSQMAGKESRDYPGIMGRLLQESFTATKYQLAGVGG
jgi:hypothetical protein